MKLNPIAANMTEVETENATVLFSYKTPVAAYLGPAFGTGKPQYVKTDHKWSVTTSKHINKWLDGATAETRPQSFFDELV